MHGLGVLVAQGLAPRVVCICESVRAKKPDIPRLPLRERTFVSLLVGSVALRVGDFCSTGREYEL